MKILMRFFMHGARRSFIVHQRGNYDRRSKRGIMRGYEHHSWHHLRRISRIDFLPEQRFFFFFLGRGCYYHRFRIRTVCMNLAAINSPPPT